MKNLLQTRSSTNRQTAVVACRPRPIGLLEYCLQQEWSEKNLVFSNIQARIQGRSHPAPPHFRKGKDFLNNLSLTKQDSGSLLIDAESFRYSLRRYVSIIIILLTPTAQPYIRPICIRYIILHTTFYVMFPFPVASSTKR